jgi:hypothetical protein
VPETIPPLLVREVHPAKFFENNPDDEINAFFRTDAPPLADYEIAPLTDLLQTSHADLLNVVLDLSQPALDHKLDDEDLSIRGLLMHVANGENWYLDRLGLAIDSADAISDPMSRAILVRQQLLDVLPQLVGVTETHTLKGETWSARKLVRRALWHERDHTLHIIKIRRKLRELTDN